MTNDKERLEYIKSYTELTWINLAKEIGIDHTQRLRDIRNGKYGISKSLADKILARYPELNPVWVKTGVGQPLLKDMRNGEDVRLYATPISGMHNGDSGKLINLGTLFLGADVAVYNNSNAMTEYPQGCILALRKLPCDAITSGNIYMMETNDFCMLRAVQADGDKFKLFATSEKKYPDGTLVFAPYTVDRSDIVAVYEVLGYIVLDNKK